MGEAVDGGIGMNKVVIYLNSCAIMFSLTLSVQDHELSYLQFDGTHNLYPKLDKDQFTK